MPTPLVDEFGNIITDEFGNVIYVAGTDTLGPFATATNIPTGGAVRIDMPAYLQPPSGITAIMLTRATFSQASGFSTFTTLYSGAPVPVWLDPGDMLAGPLLSGSSYVWRIFDAEGMFQVGPIQPASQIISKPDGLTQLLLRLLQGGVNGLAATKPAGINGILVTTEMPQGGLRRMPLMVVNLDLMQQEETGIGQDVQNPDQDNIWTIWVNATRLWRVSVFSRNATERDYYRDAVLAMWQVWHQSVFTPIGLNVSHRFQAASGTDVAGEEMQPGFYYADVMLELDGVFNVDVLESFGIISQFDVTIASSASGLLVSETGLTEDVFGGDAEVIDQVEVPPSQRQ